MGFMQIIEFRTSASDEERKLDAPPVFHDLEGPGRTQPELTTRRPPPTS
jgi:hypothetical protein